MAHVSYHASTSSSGNAFLASSCGSWIVDLGVFAHMSGTSSLLSRLHQLANLEIVFISNGCYYLVMGKRVTTNMPKIVVVESSHTKNYTYVFEFDIKI